ncbi:MAG: MBL fold metallo-hydrolase [Dactylosporangium sp.]|nr:MBL fold metallo-hydrolase [Dactylosporangium sp.]NNJ62585.1 MBL fold metallo-hydrolase [Dactylosporangium sp.]
MFVAGLIADVFATNCYLLAPERGGACVVVDPGIGVVDRLRDLLGKHELVPAAVLLTHGHFDHTGAAAAVCDAWGVPAYVHPADREQLVDPRIGVGMDLRELFGEDFIWNEPSNVSGYPESMTLRLAGLDIAVEAAPGHTAGSVLLHVESNGDRICVSGDVLLAGSVGRTDLPGGDPDAMVTTLRDRILLLPDETTVLPGHGPQTTIGHERVGNPYLRAAAAGTVGTRG